MAPGAGWFETCFCEAQVGLVERLWLAGAVTEWAWRSSTDAASLAGPVSEALEERGDRPREQLALQTLDSASHDEFATDRRPASLLTVAGWWRAAERAVTDAEFAASVSGDFEVARASHRAARLDLVDGAAMESACREIAAAVACGAAVDLRRLHEDFVAIDVARLRGDEGLDCECGSAVECAEPPGSWTGVRRLAAGERRPGGCGARGSRAPTDGRSLAQRAWRGVEAVRRYFHGP